MSKLQKELISPSGKYKAVIIERNDCYSIDIFVLNEDIDLENNCSYGEFWSRRNSTPIFVDKGQFAENLALEELRMQIGEPDTPISINWIRDFSFCKNAEFVDPKTVNVYCEIVDPDNKGHKLDKIEVNKIIKFDELYLVEEIGDDDDWQMGQVNSSGDINCWGYYGTLKDAIRAL